MGWMMVVCGGGGLMLMIVCGCGVWAGEAARVEVELSAAKKRGALLAQKLADSEAKVSRQHPWPAAFGSCS